jgi:hypothetical protein
MHFFDADRAEGNETVEDCEVWLSLVERCVRDAEAGGSNPLTSTSRDGPATKNRESSLVWFAILYIHV